MHVRLYMNWLALEGLPEFPTGAFRAIVDAGYDGVQFIRPLSRSLVEVARKFGVGVCRSGRIDQPGDAYTLAKGDDESGLLRFNADFSHWYTGNEMVYGDFQKKLEFIQPVLDRVRFLHGRIGNPGCIQVDVGDGDPQVHRHVNHFCILWTAALAGWLQNEPDPKSICFAVEVLSPARYYGRTFHGVEESDRWQQSLVVTRIATECFAAACEKVGRLC